MNKIEVGYNPRVGNALLSLSPIQWLLMAVAISLLLLALSALSRDLLYVKAAIVNIPFMMVLYAGLLPLRNYKVAESTNGPADLVVRSVLISLGLAGVLWFVLAFLGIF
jgi:hypothetical protein